AKSKKKLSSAQIFKVDPTGGTVRIAAHPVKDKDVDLASNNSNVRGQSDDTDPLAPIYRGEPSAPPVVSRRIVPPPTPPPQSLPLPSAPGQAEPEPRLNDPNLDTPWSDEWISQTIIRGQNADDPFAIPANPLFDPSPQGNPYPQIRRTPQGQIDLDY